MAKAKATTKIDKPVPLDHTTEVIETMQPGPDGRLRKHRRVIVKLTEKGMAQVKGGKVTLPEMPKAGAPVETSGR